jgi:hypothetical protein
VGEARSYACEHDVRTMAVPIARCDELMRSKGITEATLLERRRDGLVVSGGTTKRGLRTPVPNEQAFREMPEAMADALRALAAEPSMDVASGGMQTAIHHRGVKLGGTNRQHRGGTAYIASGVVLSSAHEERLAELGFTRMTKNQAGSDHEHIWWETSFREVGAFVAAIREAAAPVDGALGTSPD